MNIFFVKKNGENGKRRHHIGCTSSAMSCSATKETSLQPKYHQSPAGHHCYY
jgi:hypothetical protein